MHYLIQATREEEEDLQRQEGEKPAAGGEKEESSREQWKSVLLKTARDAHSVKVRRSIQLEEQLHLLHDSANQTLNSPCDTVASTGGDLEVDDHNHSMMKLELEYLQEELVALVILWRNSHFNPDLCRVTSSLLPRRPPSPGTRCCFASRSCLR